MSELLLNLENKNWQTANYPLILGERLGLHDSIHVTHPRLFELYKRQKSIDWTEDEVALGESRMDMTRAPKSIVGLMNTNISYQWEFDSVASRSFATLLSPFITNSEFWMAQAKNQEIECLTPDHEVLTPSGWKFINDVTISDKVYQVDIETSKGSFVRPSNVVVKKHTGTMYRFSNKQNHVSTVVTPNHRMPFKSRNTSKVGFKEAEDISYNSSTMLPVSTLAQPSFQYGDVLSSYHKFLIATQADGYVDKRLDGSVHGHISVYFNFAKQRKVDRLLSIVSDLGWAFKELKGKKEKGAVKAQRKFVVKVPLEKARHLKDFSWVSFDNVGVEWGSAFLEEIALWDGCVTGKNANWLVTTNQEVAKTVQIVAALSGYRTHFSEREDTRSERFNTTYKVSWKKLLFAGKDVVKEEVQYEGNVYCLTVPTSAFLIRHNGAISVTGNCLHALTYSEIVRQCIPDVNLIFKSITENQKITGRSKVVFNVMEDLALAGAQYNLGLIKADQALFNRVFKGLVAMYLAERLQFMSSFATTFITAEQGYFVGICKLIQKIAIDELTCHAEVLAYVIQNLIKNDPRAQIAMSDCWGEINQIFNAVKQTEYDWSKYIFTEGRKAVGLTTDLLIDWVDFNAHFAGLPLQISTPQVVSNPLKYMDNWLDIDSTQNANQEGDNTNYVKVHAVDDLGDEEID